MTILNCNVLYTAPCVSVCVAAEVANNTNCLLPTARREWMSMRAARFFSLFYWPAAPPEPFALAGRAAMMQWIRMCHTAFDRSDLLSSGWWIKNVRSPIIDVGNSHVNVCLSGSVRSAAYAHHLWEFREMRNSALARRVTF